MNIDEYDALNFDLKKDYHLACAKTHIIKTGSNKPVFLTILLGGLNESNPKAFMDNVVADFVNGRMYNEYIDANLDNPWLRIIIEDINDLVN